jgi:pantetheine-phosphate adenylyltransferase
MSTVYYPGSFDPPTIGHLDLIRRASWAFDKVIVVIARNEKKQGLFSLAERTDMMRKCCAKMDNVEVNCLADGTLVDYVRIHGGRLILRGIRNGTDYEYEADVAAANKFLDEEIETICMPCTPALSHISSSNTKAIGLYQSVRGLVPEELVDEVNERIGGNK